MGSGVKISTTIFKNSFKLKHPDLILIEEYTNMKTLIKVKDELGITYLCRPQELLLGKKPTIQSATDKIDAFIKKSVFKNGNKYDYSNVLYVNARTPVQLICSIHGSFYVTPDCHINRGNGCNECGKINSILNRNKDTYAGWTPNAWLKAANKSKRFSGFKFYILECRNDTEHFFKIGRTYHKIKKRFEDKNKMPYKWKLIYVKEGSHNFIFDFERCIYKFVKQFSYKPEINFDGCTECFTIPYHEYLNELIDRISNEEEEEQQDES